jgi:hypothetical protein
MPLRQLWEHGTRLTRHHDARGEWTLRWVNRGRTKVAFGTHDVMDQLSRWLPLPNGERLVNPMSYCGRSVKGSVHFRYTPQCDGDPRWWIEVREEHHRNDDDDLNTPSVLSARSIALVVECDPPTSKWDSDDDEKIDHWEHGQSAVEWTTDCIDDREVPIVDSCRVCRPVERPHKKQEDMDD